MGLAEVLISFVALMIAVWALMLQRKQIIKNSKINALVHMSSLLNQKIEFHSKIIADLKLKKENWKGHAEKINNDLRPLKEKIDSVLIDIIATYADMPNSETIKKMAIGERNVS